MSLHATEITAGIRVIDVEHLGRPHVIGACLIEADGALALVDPGPTSTLDTLLAKLEALGVGPGDLDALLLTHIHLDHAGATGDLLARNPRLRVYVHARGAPHLIDPSRLMTSARRLWPDELDELWGDMRPVSADALTVLEGGERIELGSGGLGSGGLGSPGRIDVAATPGHASHHVAYAHVDSGTVFAGDTAGVRMPGTSYLLPPTPPPDIDIEAWLASIDTVASWEPERVVMTHFGAVEAVDAHLDALRERLGQWASRVREGLASGESDEAQCAAFVGQVEAEIREALDEADAAAILQASPPDLCWWGLARYWRKRS